MEWRPAPRPVAVTKTNDPATAGRILRSLNAWRPRLAAAGGRGVTRAGLGLATKSARRRLVCTRSLQVHAGLQNAGFPRARLAVPGQEVMATTVPKRARPPACGW